MSNITKLNLYLNEYQYKKLCQLAETSGKTPEQVANESIYSYLAIVDPFAVDYDDMTPEQREEYDKRFYEEENNPQMLYDPLDPNVELDEEGHKI